MTRSIRIEYPEGFYRVMARGNRREAIFVDDDERIFLLHKLKHRALIDAAAKDANEAPDFFRCNRDGRPGC